MGTALCSGSHVLGERLEAWRSTLIKTGVEGNGTPHEASATRCGSSTDDDQRASARSAGFGLEDGDLAARHEAPPSFAFRCGASPAGTSRLLRSKPHPEEWLLVEWPRGDAEPTKYWLSTLPAHTKIGDLVRLAKQRWIIERDYQELKQELGLGHFEGRGWRGFHHHATLCIAAYGFLVAERSRFSPSARPGQLHLRAPQLPPDFKPRGAPRAGRAA